MEADEIDIFNETSSSESDESIHDSDDDEHPQHLNPSVVIIANPNDVDMSDDDDDDDDEMYETGDSDSNGGDSEDDDDGEDDDDDEDEDDGTADEQADEIGVEDQEDDDDENEAVIVPIRRRSRHYSRLNVVEDSSNSSSITFSSASSSVSATVSNDEGNSEDGVAGEADDVIVVANVDFNQENVDTDTGDTEIIYIADNDDRENLSRNAPSFSNSQRTTERNIATVATLSHSITSLSRNTADGDPETPSRKRRREASTSPKTETPKVKAIDNDDEDDGLTCPICLDTWEMSGVHRLVALKCGHLFGDECIRRWLTESTRQSGSKVCPQCKARASPRDIRFLYARRVRALDRSEEHNLRELLQEERKKNALLQTDIGTMKMAAALLNRRLHDVEESNERMKKALNNQLSFANSNNGLSNRPCPKIRIFLDGCVDICREPGCRVMYFADQKNALLVSSKGGQKLFPGFGIRFVDTTTLKASNYVHATTKLIRDICMSPEQDMMAVASTEPTSKIFDVRTKTAIHQYSAGSNTPLWSCDIGKYYYLGAQVGVTYIYDMRKPNAPLFEYSAIGDNSPVIKIAHVPSTKSFPLGGFLVCTLRNLWFYEYIPGEKTQIVRLHIDGPFMSLNYNKEAESLLISTRSNSTYPTSRYLFGKLAKEDGITFFKETCTFSGAKTNPIMSRASQLTFESRTLISGYTQDSKLLTMYDVESERCLQSVPVQDVVFDICPIYTAQDTYLAALTETKTRLYKIIDTK